MPRLTSDVCCGLKRKYDFGVSPILLVILEEMTPVAPYSSEFASIYGSFLCDR